MVPADLAVEEGEPPEAHQRQVVGLDRPADQLGQEVVDRGQRQRRVEQAEHVVAEPPVHRRRLHAAVKAGDVGDEEQHRKPEQRAPHVPDRYVEVGDLAPEQREDQRQAHEGAAGDEQDVDLPGDLEPLHAVADAIGEAAQPGDQRRVPQRPAEHRIAAADEFGLEQARNDEQRRAEAGHRRPAIGHRVEMHGADAAEAEPGLRHQPVGRMELDRGGESRRRGHEQPDEGTTVEEEHHRSGRGIRRGAVEQFLAIDRAGTTLQSAMWRQCFRAANLAAGEDHLAAFGRAIQQAAALRPDEETEADEREHEGRHQDREGVHGRFACKAWVRGRARRGIGSEDDRQHAPTHAWQRR